MFFAAGEDIFESEGKYGDHFAEVIFDKKDPDFKKLTRWYFYEGKSFRGHTLKIGDIIDISSDEYKQIKKKYIG